MKTAFTTTLKASLLTLSLLVSANVFAASGEGRNGPDQSGVSIPVHLDRGISLRVFKQALSICENEASRSLLSQMLRQDVGNLKIPSTGSKFYDNSWAFDINGVPVNFIFAVKTPSSPHPLLKFRNIWANNFPKNVEIKKFNVNEDIFKTIKAAYDEEATFVGGLKVDYNLKSDSGYDELGSFDGGNQIIVNYTVSSSSIFRINNFAPARPVALELPAKDLAECMQNQLN